jgi:hypothetical protein
VSHLFGTGFPADSLFSPSTFSSSCSFIHSTMTRLFGMYPRIKSPVGRLLVTTRLRFAKCVPFSTTADKNNSTIAVTTAKVEVTKTATVAAAPDETKKPKRRRRRTAFGDSVADIPSFEEFQQQVAIRTLYRQFLRLVRPLRDSSPEIGPQIRREFRVSAVDSWQAKRALSEGGRRYKELAAMLGSQTKAHVQSDGTQNTNDDADDSTKSPQHQRATSKSAYPWQQSSGTFRPHPSRFPSKSPGST